MTDLAKLVVRLEAQTGQYQAQLEKAQGQLERFEKAGKSALGNLAGIVAGVSFVEIGKSAIEAADRMGDLSKQTGISVEQLSRLTYAASQTGASGEVLVGAFRNLSKSAVEARQGTGEAADAYAALGVSVVDANGNLKDGQALLLEVAQAFSEQEDGAAKSAVAMKIFGKAGAEIIPFLDEGAAGIQKLMDKSDALGATLSTEAAEAATKFSNSMKDVKAEVMGVIMDALTPLLPVLTSAVDEFTGATAGAHDFSDATEFLQTGLKLLTDVGMSVVFTFRAVGKDLGALAAAAVKFATGSFSEAATILRERRMDDEAESAQFQKALNRLWSDGMDETIDIVTVKAKKIGLAYRLGAKNAGDGLTDVAVSAAKIYVSPMEALYDKLDADTQTTAEKQVAAFRKTEAELNELLNSKRLSPEEYGKRYAEALDEVLPEIEVKAEKIGNKLKGETEKVNEFTKRAMENTVDLIADGLYGAIHGGIKDIPAEFADMLLKLALQAEAAQIGKLIFGDDGKGGSGFLGSIGGIIKSVVGGGKAAGGPVSPGTIYPVNENTPNTEWFAPAVAGTIIPAGKMGGGATTNIFQFTVPAPNGNVSRQTQSQIAAAAGRGLSQANRKNN